MFGWLANLLVKSSVVGGSCPCCEAQKEQLKEMQKAVLTGNLTDDVCESTCSYDCSCDFSSVADDYKEMKTKYSYKL